MFVLLFASKLISRDFDSINVVRCLPSSAVSLSSLGVEPRRHNTMSLYFLNDIFFKEIHWRIKLKKLIITHD